MKFWKKILLAALLASPLVAGCKKDDDTTKEYMDGTLSISIPIYMLPGDSKTFNIDTLMTMSKSNGAIVGYYYTNPIEGICDTLVYNDGSRFQSTFTITAPDSLGTFSFTFVAMGDDNYYSTTATGQYTVVKPGINGDKSLTGYKMRLPMESMTDPRDGREYLVSDVDGTYWMRQNLAWEGAGIPFRQNKAINDVFGRFYTWEEAQTACPEGWRLPVDADFVALGKKYASSAKAASDIAGLSGSLMEDIYFNGDKMWEYWPNVNMTNAAGLSLLPVGYSTISEGEYEFDEFSNYSAIWTGNTKSGNGVFRYVYVDKSDLYIGAASKTDFAVNVRCVK